MGQLTYTMAPHRPQTFNPHSTLIRPLPTPLPAPDLKPSHPPIQPQSRAKLAVAQPTLCFLPSPPSPRPVPRPLIPPPMDSAAASLAVSPASDDRFWDGLRTRVDTILEDRRLVASAASTVLLLLSLRRSHDLDPGPNPSFCLSGAGS